MDELVKVEVLSIEKLTGNVQLIQQAMAGVMKNDTHYGVVKGCGNKKVLLKPGAEVIMSMFQLGGEPIIEKTTDGFDVSYEIKYKGFHAPTGNVVGYGVGCGSTSEDKFAWRASVCDDEFEATIPSRRRIHYAIDFNTKKPIAVKQVRQNPATVANTVLKMAKKRAQVDFVLTATACSDMFVQDLEEDEINNAVNTPKQQYQKPQPQAGTDKFAKETPEVITEGQAKRLFAIGKGKNLTNEEMSFIVFNISGVNHSKEIPRDQYDAVIAAIETAKTGKVM
jgi:hypothetical protein